MTHIRSPWCSGGTWAVFKHASVLNRLGTRSHPSHHACHPVEHIVVNVLNNPFVQSFERYYKVHIVRTDRSPTNAISRHKVNMICLISTSVDSS
ncbi:hypothetical protein Y032_0260g512 [Ancylostoma ceylanicum]|uniref:Uncharacterized protein n=1 Tax=Ancylostoma ceylanicum TaxID=53326 RepID=A0A016SBB7_9BILA|nr:hypothetical protein Y032_0260g512 [Ancylostoma ceylanicum]